MILLRSFRETEHSRAENERQPMMDLHLDNFGESIPTLQVCRLPRANARHRGHLRVAGKRPARSTGQQERQRTCLSGDALFPSMTTCRLFCRIRSSASATVAHPQGLENKSEEHT